jgi:putative transposase
VRPRRAIRIPGFDYASYGPYFVTVCTRDRRCTLGDVEDERVVLSPRGRVVRREIKRLPERLAVELDDFVVMPNHVHLIVCLGTRARQASPPRLGAVVGSFKAGSSRVVGEALWQRGYYEHVARDPIRWAVDPESPDNVS